MSTRPPSKRRRLALASQAETIQPPISIQAETVQPDAMNQSKTNETVQSMSAALLRKLEGGRTVTKTNR